MNNLPLPLKYRPKIYEDLIGQELSVRFLQALSKKRLGRNLVIYGQFGSGKTSATRIYAKSLNCLDLSPEGNPCYVCEACRDTSNIIELDAASFSGKEDVKNLLETAKTPPLLGKYRIVIADEAQQFSKAAWDALLKSIEEPKAHQVFIFSTTELEKVRDAIKSRCQCLSVKLLSPDASKKHLKKICELEKFQWEETALDIISFMSKGHPRDLLKNLEQVSFLGDITIENARVIFNLGYLTHLLTLVKRIQGTDTKTFRDILTLFDESPKTILEVLKQMHLYFYYFCINKAQVDINPAFTLLPAQNISQLWERYRELLGTDTSGNFLKVMKLLNTLQDSSFATLEIGLLELHNFIHVKKCDETLKDIEPTAAVKTDTTVKRRKGRQFVTIGQQNPLVPRPEPVATTPAPVTREPENIKKTNSGLEVPEKIYPHTLLSLGFVRKEITSDNLIVLEQ